MIEPDEESSSSEQEDDIAGDWGDINDLLVWPCQEDFIFSDAPKAGLFTGAGYGKSNVLIQAALKQAVEQDGWWNRSLDWKSNPLKILMGAPHNRYLVTRLIPGFNGQVDDFERRIGRTITKRTGRKGDGWFTSASERRREMENGTTFYFYGLHESGNAVAMDSIGLYIDEVTMLRNQDIWQRAQNRCRDPRANTQRIRVVGTPEKGHFIYDDFYDNDIVKPGCEVFTASSLTNPLLTDQFFQTMASASDFYIDMQVMGQWVKGASGQRFARSFDEDVHLQPMSIPPNHPGARFDIGWDPGYASGQIVIMYYSEKRKIWYVVDEIVIQGFGTQAACEMLRNKGYGAHNIRRIFMDPKDATKHKSNGPQTDESIVHKMLGVRPRVASVPGRNAMLRTRLDALDEMLKNNRVIINSTLKPKNTRSRGLVNAIKNFSLQKSRSDEGRELDRPTSETVQEWKHSIDAIHYVLMNYEHDVYRKVTRNDPDKVVHRRKER